MKRLKDLSRHEKKEDLFALFMLPFAYHWHTLRMGVKLRTLCKGAAAVCLSFVMVLTMLPMTSVFATATECTSAILSHQDDNAADIGDDALTSNGATKTGSWEQGTENVALTVSKGSNTYTMTFNGSGETEQPVATYVITFNANGGTVTEASCKVILDSDFSSDFKNVPQLTNHTFAGWYTARSGGEKVFDANGAVAGTYWVKDGTELIWKHEDDVTLYAQWTLNQYTVTWKNYDGTVLKTTKVDHGATPVYSGTTPAKPEDEDYTYTFNGWSPALSAITGNVAYTAQFEPVLKPVEPAYTITIPASIDEGQSFTVSATGVVLNTDQKLTVTLQSDFTFRNEESVTLPFGVYVGNDKIATDTVILTITGNGDKYNPLAGNSQSYTVKADQKAQYSGTYKGTITFIIAVNTVNS